MPAKLDRSDLVIEHLLKALKINSKSEAEHFYRQTLLVNPKNIRVLQELGAFQMRKGQFQGAFDFYKKALELDPNNAKSLSDIGEAQRKLGYYWRLSRL